MNFALSEEQQMLQSMAREFVSRESSLQRVRALREDPLGYSPEVWRKMAELGWLGIALPEHLGGQEMGMVELTVVMEELGRGLVPEPMLASVCTAAHALLLGGSEAQQGEWLPRLAEGEAVLTLAWQEREGRYDAFNVSASAARDGESWVLNGEKTFVPDARGAARLLVTARTGGSRRDPEGVGIFLVDPEAEGVTLRETPMMDSRRRYEVRLENVRVPGEALLAGENPADVVLERTLERATVGVSAEMLGTMCEAFERTVDYLKTRQQFGRPIGAFQALKHRAADQYVQTELSRSAVYYAAMCIDEQMADASAAVSTAKARCNDAMHLIGNEAIQMHGGIGMTDEHDIGLFFKRGRVAEVTLGDTAHHLDRYARLKEY